MQVVSIEDLRIWQTGHALVLSVYKMTRLFPDEERYCLTNQVRRSAISICANIAEGYRKSRKDFVRYLGIALGSLEETQYYIVLSKIWVIQKSQFDSLMLTSNFLGK